MLSCAKSSCLTEEIPDCIQDIIQNYSSHPTLQSVQTQLINEIQHYWLQTGAISYDGVEYIVNSSCDTVCYLCGECMPPSCSLKYGQDWKVIWKK